jgi:hypothetical protein
MMSYQKFADAYIQPQYTTLQPVNNDASANFSQELQIFLSHNPEFNNNKMALDILHYCYDHYINCDPISRDLPLQEKLKKSGEMARNFIRIIIGTKG